MIQDPYKAYVENSTIAADPIQLVIALYERAIECTRQARTCLETGDVWARSKAVTKAMNILTELIASLNPQAGAEVGRNLDRLYHYMQKRLLDGHAKQIVEPFAEVERLLRSLLEAWYTVARNTEQNDAVSQLPQPAPEIEDSQSPYHAYLGRSVAASGFASVTG